MKAGAAVSAIALTLSLAVAIGDIKAAARGRWLGYSLTTARLSHLQPLIIAVVAASGLAAVGLWLWMARANGQGSNWARILSTGLLAVAAAELSRNHGLAQLFWAITCLTGLAAVSLLWRPASSAFFTPHRARPAGTGDRQRD